MKLFHCIVVMGAAIGGGCGGNVVGHREGDGGAAADGTSSMGIDPESGPADEAAGFILLPQEASTNDDAAGLLGPQQDAADAGTTREACCGDGAADAAGPCADNRTFPAHQWVCQSYEPPAGCSCSIVVAIL